MLLTNNIHVTLPLYQGLEVTSIHKALVRCLYRVLKLIGCNEHCYRLCGGTAIVLVIPYLPLWHVLYGFKLIRLKVLTTYIVQTDYEPRVVVSLTPYTVAMCLLKSNKVV